MVLVQQSRLADECSCELITPQSLSLMGGISLKALLKRVAADVAIAAIMLATVSMIWFMAARSRSLSEMAANSAAPSSDPKKVTGLTVEEFVYRYKPNHQPEGQLPSEAVDPQ